MKFDITYLASRNISPGQTKIIYKPVFVTAGIHQVSELLVRLFLKHQDSIFVINPCRQHTLFIAVKKKPRNRTSLTCWCFSLAPLTPNTHYFEIFISSSFKPTCKSYIQDSKNIKTSASCGDTSFYYVTDMIGIGIKKSYIDVDVYLVCSLC